MNKIHIDQHLKIMTEYYQLPYFAKLQFCNVWLDKSLWPFDVPENVTFKTGLPEDGADERRNVSEYYFNSATWCTRSGALKVGLMKTVLTRSSQNDEIGA
jgi:hypothetical protein